MNTSTYKPLRLCPVTVLYMFISPNLFVSISLESWRESTLYSDHDAMNTYKMQGILYASIICKYRMRVIIKLHKYDSHMQGNVFVQCRLVKCLLMHVHTHYEPAVYIHITL